MTFDLPENRPLRNIVFYDSPFNSEVTLRQNKCFLLGLFFLSLELGLLPLPNFEGVLEADGFDNQLEGHSLLRAEGKALVNVDSHNHTGLNANWKRYPIQIV